MNKLLLSLMVCAALSACGKQETPAQKALDQLPKNNPLVNYQDSPSGNKKSVDAALGNLPKNNPLVNYSVSPSPKP